MKQREHETLLFSRRLRNPERLEAATLTKRGREATYVFTFFEIAAAGRMSEKGPAIPGDINQNGPDHDV
jgi:hypothetical protein